LSIVPAPLPEHPFAAPPVQPTRPPVLVAFGRRDSWLASTALIVAAIALGFALQLNNGAYTSGAMGLVTLAFSCCILAIVGPRIEWIERWGDAPAVFVLGLGLAFQFAVNLASPAGIYLQGGVETYVPHHAAIAVAALLAGAGLSKRSWLGAARMPLLLAVYFFLGTWLIKASPNPHIDVYAWHQESFQAIARGENPYALTMPNIYGFTGWYAEGLATPSRVSVGFPYPPLSFALAWLGQRVGDYRYATLVAITASGALFAYARPGRLSQGIATLFLFTPRGLMVLEQGWTEPLVVVLASATVFCACRIPKVLPMAFGLLLAIKQYAIFLIPIAPFLMPPPRSPRRFADLLLKSGLLAALVTVPMALWNLRAFISSVILFQGKQPFRADALSYLAWSAQEGIPRLPLWINFAVAVAMVGLVWWRAPRTPAGFSAAGALIFFAFFAFAKQAFCNYYFMILGFICCAVAAMHAPSSST
jgi:hypothetical protein